jgi:tetratricopeptide (TPR) repeat protein
MRLTGCIILLFAFAGIGASGQTILPDSILNRIPRGVPDSSRVVFLNTLSSDFLKTNPFMARRIATYASDLAKRAGFIRGYARSLTVIGNSYWYEGVYEFAQNYYLLAARHYENVNDKRGLSYVYNNIGEVNKKLGDYNRALDFLIRSLKMREGDSTIALTLYNIGEVYFLQKNYRESEKYVTESLKVAEEHGDERSILYAHWMIGKINLERDGLKSALPYFDRAIDGWKSIGEIRTLVQTYHDLANAYLKEGNATRAMTLLHRAMEEERKVNIAELRVQTYLALARLDSLRGEYRDALRHLTRHNALKDSIYNIAKVEQIARVQAIYETERKDRENEQLRSEKLIREQQLRSREGLLVAITGGLLIVVLLAITLIQQRSRILKANDQLQQKNEEIKSQKESIELQAVTLMKLNEELNELNKTLEIRIEERSKQLLIQNQKLAEYSFVNAHKLRAPVASILGLIQLINQVSPEERETILKHLKTCADQLDAIILEISKNLSE